MVKKIFNILLCMVLLLQNYIFLIPVKALENPVIKINSIKQGDEILTETDGIYSVDGYDEIYIDYEVENFNENSVFEVRYESSGGSGGSHRYTGRNMQQIVLDFNNEITDFTISICEDQDCNNVYASKTIKLKLTYFNELINSNIYITKVIQGGKQLELTEYNYFDVNDYQDVTFYIKGENLMDDVPYSVETHWSYNDNNTFLGSEIEQGIEITHLTNINDYLDFSWDVGNIGYNQQEKIYYDGEDYHSFIFNYVPYEGPTYEYNLGYTNYDDIAIKETDDEYQDYLIIDNKYSDEDNSLYYKIKGIGYLDKDYDVTIDVVKGEDSIYRKSYQTNGIDLNNGYKFELSNLKLDLNKEIENSDLYEFYVSVDGVTNKLHAKYNSIGKDARLTTEFFFENGKKNLSVFRGDGNYYFTSGIFDTNEDVFNKYSSIYLHYLGINFNENEEYDYVLEYGNFKEEFYNASRIYELELKMGKIDGKTLNNIGILFKVDNNKNFENPTYRLTIKKGEEVVYSDSPVLYIVSAPTLANASLSANNKNLYLKTSDYSYIATRNAPIDIVISGLGFDEDKTYPFNFCYSEIIDGQYQDSTCEIKNIKGKDLNKGTAKIKFANKINSNVDQYDFYVTCDTDEFINQNIAIQGGFQVTFVDSKDLFPNLTNYYVDNVEDLIKNIKKNTSVKDFIENLTVADNGKVKLFDATGENEITGNVGTGMIARVLNEYDENVLDLDVVVKGDVTGDGNISITDLVKVKRHISEKQQLTGVYETAGNVTDTGSISASDLLKISRDVANIEEVQ